MVPLKLSLLCIYTGISDVSTTAADTQFKETHTKVSTHCFKKYVNFAAALERPAAGTEALSRLQNRVGGVTVLLILAKIH